MATPRNTKPTAPTTPTASTFDNADDRFEMQEPPTFTDEPSENGGSASLTFEQLSGVGFNDAQDEAEFARLNPPVGDWIKGDTWQWTQRINEQDQAGGDINPQGRTFFTFQGKPEPRTANGLEYAPTFFLRISPDRRGKQAKPDEVDLAYKLFLKAKELYLSLHDEKVRNMGQLVAMLADDSYVIRSMNGDNGPVCVDIKPKRQQR